MIYLYGERLCSTRKYAKWFDPSPVAIEIGFEQGDKLVDVDGEPLENVLDINRNLLLDSL